MAWIKTCITGTEYRSKWSGDEWIKTWSECAEYCGEWIKTHIVGIAVDVLMGWDVLIALSGLDRWMARMFCFRVFSYVLFYIYIFPLLFQQMYTNIILLGARSLQTDHKCQNEGLATLPVILDIYRIASLNKFGLEWMYGWHWIKGGKVESIDACLARWRLIYIGFDEKDERARTWAV